jgi:hypothetical protein
MKSKTKKNNVALEYKSTIWKTEIKGPNDDPLIRRLIIIETLVAWIINGCYFLYKN